MPCKAYAFILATLIATPVNALQYPATCRGPSATVAMIEGLDSQKARLSAIYTQADAVAFCNQTLRWDVNSGGIPKPAQVLKCTQEFMASHEKTQIRVEANCKRGTMRLSDLQKTVTMPVEENCPDRGIQVTAIFQTLCPVYADMVKENKNYFNDMRDEME